jgi:hypothetical protein
VVRKAAQHIPVAVRTLGLVQLWHRRAEMQQVCGGIHPTTTFSSFSTAFSWCLLVGVWADSCNATIQHDVSSDHDGHALAGQLSAGHTDICPWRDNPCPQTFTQFPARSAQQIKDEFNVRVKNVLPLFREHPGCECICPEGFPEAAGGADLGMFVNRLSSAGVLTVQPSESEQAAGEYSTSPLLKAVLMSIFGWDRHDHDEGARLGCKLCGRRLQLEYFDAVAPTAAGNGSNTSNGEMKHKRAKTTKPVLNPATEHRSYCPWVLSNETAAASSQSGAAAAGGSGSADVDPTASPTAEAWSIAGWRVVLQVLMAELPLYGTHAQAPSTTPDARGSEQPRESVTVRLSHFICCCEGVTDDVFCARQPEEVYYKIKKVLDFASRAT